jgi:hypothetical protein
LALGLTLIQHDLILIDYTCKDSISMEFYSAMKKSEILSFAGKWMELENIILSEVSQTQKAKNRMFFHI